MSKDPFLNYLSERPLIRKVLPNTFWLLANRIVQLLVNVFLSAWMARYLGPSDMGIFNYALVIIGIFSVFSFLGLDSIIIRDITQKIVPSNKFTEEKEINNRISKESNTILGTAFVIKLVGGFVVIALSTIFTYYKIATNPQLDFVLLPIIIILSSRYILSSFDVIDFWYQSKVASKYVVIARSIAFLVMSALKVLIILTSKGLIYFAIILFIETVIATVLLIIQFRISKQKILFWKYDKSCAKYLLLQGLPLLISAIFVAIYSRIDQLVIGDKLTPQDLGIYGVSIKLSEIWLFVPSAILSSVVPSLILAKKTDKNLYWRRIQNILDVLVWISIFASIFFTVAGGFIIKILFGDEYMTALPALKLITWNGVFIVTGMIFSEYNVIENKTKVTILQTIIGLLIGYVCSVILIPKVGIVGGAISMIIAQSVSGFILPAFFTHSRGLFLSFIRAFDIFRIIKNFYYLYVKLRYKRK
ncbi:MAG TPA: flippase [Candidatus Dojkabacteria bacterium]|nr:flippase [Candidatus Dojkabacteria bacterium]